MSGSKRRRDLVEDETQVTAMKELVDGDNLDLPRDIADLSLPEVLNSILHQSLILPLEDTENANSTYSDTTVTSIPAPFLLDRELGQVSAEVADVSHRIQEWTDHHIYGLVAETTLNTTASHHADHYTSEAPVSLIKCFGAISSARARLVGDMVQLHAKLSSMASYVGTLSMKVVFTKYYFSLSTADGLVVAQLTESLTNSLSQIIKLSSVELEAFTTIKDALRRIKKATRLHESGIEVDINIYGSLDVRQKIGRVLSEDKVFLQDPIHRRRDFEYDNPHMVAFEGIDMADIDAGDRRPANNLDPSDITKAVKEIEQYETKDRGLVGLSNTTHINTRLLTHQQQALEFMIQREIGPIPEDFQLWYHAAEQTDDRSGFFHKITGCWTFQPLPEIGGGILADDMGMGKTLSTLSLICQRLPDGWKWSQSQDDSNRRNGTNQTSSRATLVVVSSLLIMNLWFKEIHNHLDGTLKVLKYHGKGREKTITHIANSDIVLTTYHTLAAERKTKNTPIASITWFRIVLDEAHTIRRQSTSLFAAVFGLDSCHRWCLSGTPIQNRLDDLGALLAFIRFDPFDKASMFRKHVSLLAMTDPAEAKSRLMTILDVVCLRRSIKRLHLQPLKPRVHKVNFSALERSHYDKTREFMQHAMSYGSRERFSQTPFGKFQIQLRLRILCNHGTFQKPYQWGQVDAQTQQEDAMSSMGKHHELRCSSCCEPMPVLETNCAISKRVRSSGGVLCNECTSHLSKMSDKEDAFMSDDLEGKDENFAKELSRLPRITRASSFSDSGHSSKIEALMEDVRKDLSETKSIVFSCWTRSLDLVKRHLDQLTIPHERIDGDTAINRRQEILDQFSQSSSVRVLLMTTGTGAYGLNLAVANRVFILEPQWNPSIEDQAVARVQRLLQTRTVQVVRYVVSGTVEDDILRQQQRKMKDAEMGFRSAQERRK